MAIKPANRGQEDNTVKPAGTGREFDHGHFGLRFRSKITHGAKPALYSMNQPWLTMRD